MKKCLNNRANFGNLDLSYFFSKIGLIRLKKKIKKLFCILLLHPVLLINRNIYLKPYIHVQIICIRLEYSKPCNCVQTNDYRQVHL